MKQKRKHGIVSTKQNGPHRTGKMPGSEGITLVCESCRRGCVWRIPLKQAIRRFTAVDMPCPRCHETMCLYFNERNQ